MNIEEVTLNAIERIERLDRDITALDEAIAETYKVVEKVESNMKKRK